jgi:UDPglucose 6-dehydrogenase
MRVLIVGTGYVGLVTGLCFCEMGYEVVCVDNDHAKIDRINKGELPFFERGLQRLLDAHRDNSFSVSTDLERNLSKSDVVFVTVGTPYKNNSIDLSYVKNVMTEIGSFIRSASKYHAIVIKSTVVPGTTDSILKPIIEQASGKTAEQDFGLAMCPEFLREGEAVEDCLNPDRIIIGANSIKTKNILEELFSPFHDVNKICTNSRTAEMIKYTSNSFFATLISFSNEVANMCNVIGDIDPVEVMSGLHQDQRLNLVTDNGKTPAPLVSYLHPGPGFGGSCFPKDVNAIISHTNKKGYKPELLDAVMKINRSQPNKIYRLILSNCNDIDQARIGILGLSFKPNTDDTRESTFYYLYKLLERHKCTILGYDPLVKDLPYEIDNFKIMASVHELIRHVDIVVLMTVDPCFNNLPELLMENDGKQLLVDTRRLIEKDRYPHYCSIGVNSAQVETLKIESRCDLY